MKNVREEMHALLNVFGKNELDRPSLVKNFPRYKEAKQAILTLAEVLWESDEKAKVNIVEEMGTAISLHAESPLIATFDLGRLSASLSKATRIEIFPAAGGIGMCVIFDGVFIKPETN